MRKEEIGGLVGEDGSDGSGEAVAPDSDAPAGSILDQLRDKRRALSQDKTKVIDVAGYGGQLAVEYGRMDYDELSPLLNKMAKVKSSQAELNIMTDVLVRACRSVLVRPEDGGKLTALNEVVPEFGDDPVRYDKRLAEACELKVDATRARLICQGLFNNDLALVAHSNELIEWMKDSEEEASEDF